MEVYNSSVLPCSPFVLPTSFAHTYTPSYLPHSPTLTLTDIWQQQQQHLPARDYELFQMQHPRFPTPPITPPRPSAEPHAESPHQRTQSVIMKIGQGLSPQHVPAEMSMLDDPKAATSPDATGSDSSTPGSDYFCDWIDCGRYFANLESLAMHVNQIHAVASSLDGLYYCRWSGCQRTERGFNARYKMLVHTRTHTKEKPHQCHLCEKSFSRAENLKIHIRSHSGERPYLCTFEGCSKRYSNSSDRFKHTRTHSMEKPYMCKIPGCQKRYTDPSSLRKHVKTFKHAEQLIDTAVPRAFGARASAGQQYLQPQYHPQNVAPHCQSGYSLRAKEPAPQYICVSPPPNAHYYLGMETADEEACHIKSSQLEDYYYSAAAAKSATYWSDDSEQQAGLADSRALEYHRSDFSGRGADKLAMDCDMQLDGPLDLRTNRN